MKPAGPSSTRALYGPSGAGAPRVDELMLSLFLGEALAEGVEGESFCAPERLAQGFACVHRCDREEPSGPWRFERWLRR